MVGMSPPVQAVLFDMDGVVYNSEVPIPGAADALAWIRSRQFPHLFVTNTTSRSRSVLARKLASFGISASESQILTPAAVAVEFLRTERSVRPTRLALLLPEAAHSEFSGMDLVPPDAESGADFVIIGDLGEQWSFTTLNRAFRLLQSNPATEFFALSGTKFWQGASGLQLDTAPFTAALECATGRRARVFGKPSRDFFEAALHLLGVSAAETLMIGDDLEADVAGAQQAGLRAALVRTGKFRPEQLTGPIEPDVILSSIAELPSFLSESPMP